MLYFTEILKIWKIVAVFPFHLYFSTHRFVLMNDFKRIAFDEHCRDKKYF